MRSGTEMEEGWGRGWRVLEFYQAVLWEYLLVPTLHKQDLCETGVLTVIGSFLFRLREGAFGRGRRLACPSAEAYSYGCLASARPTLDSDSPPCSHTCTCRYIPEPSGPALGCTAQA